MNTFSWVYRISAKISILSLASFICSSATASPDAAIETIDQATHERNVQKIDSLAPKQTQIINTIPGPKANKEDLLQGKVEKGPGLNPFAWIFRPVTKLQAQTARLEQQVVKLTGPIAALQPSMQSLNNKMGEVKDEMGKVEKGMTTVAGGMVDVGHGMGRVEKRMGGVANEMTQVQNEIKQMRVDIRSMRNEMLSLRKPIAELQQPIASLKAPVHNLAKPVSTIGKRMNSLDQQMHDLKMILNLVLSSIYVAAAIIAVGTPIAAILVWKHRQQLMKGQAPTSIEIRDHHAPST